MTADAPEAAPALAGETTILIPLADLIDPAAEVKRLSRERDAKQVEYERAQVKLSNENYLARAPADVVARERLRAAELASALARLQEQLAKIEAMARR